MPVIDAIICCPRCRSKLTVVEGDMGKPPALKCTNAECRYSEDGFFYQNGQPVLVDFEGSIFEADDFSERQGVSILPRIENVDSLKYKVRRLIRGENKVARHFCREMLEQLRLRTSRPRILVVGGGTVGSGVREMYERDDVEIVGTDVYTSAHTQLVADAHQLPFVDGSFDAVWIQAVLEHVLDPTLAVAEIHRVLKPDGLVYADTPFMQQVHEGAYDFTRFTVSGHRWLFRGFTLLSAGSAAGAGTASLWSLRYLLRALTGSPRFAQAATIPFFWLRFLDGWAKTRLNNDAASGVYFFGSKAQAPISPREMVAFYEAQAAPGS